MRGNKCLLLFTKAVYEFLCSGLTIKDALDCISRIEHFPKRASLAALEISSSLKEGSLFSLALKRCVQIRFDAVYIAFMSALEKGGDALRTVSFLLKREEGFYERKNKIVGMSIYPLCVSLFAFVGSICIFVASYSLVPAGISSFDTLAYKTKALYGMIFANMLLLIAFVLLLFVLTKNSLLNELVDVFRIIDFAHDGNGGISEALCMGFSVVKKHSALSMHIALAITLIERGESVAKAIACISKEAEMYIRLAEKTGNIGNAFKQIVIYFETKLRQREKICLSLLEPMIMLILALYIIVLLKTVLMPVLFLPQF